MSPSQHNLLALTEWSTVDAGNTMDAGRRFRLFPFFFLKFSHKIARGQALWDTGSGTGGRVGFAGGGCVCELKQDHTVPRHRLSRLSC